MDGFCIAISSSFLESLPETAESENENPRTEFRAGCLCDFRVFIGRIECWGGLGIPVPPQSRFFLGVFHMSYSWIDFWVDFKRFVHGWYFLGMV
jgi:hypothetical protein